MKKIKDLEVRKEDYTDLEKFLLKNELLGTSKIWFAGFDDRARGINNAVAQNLFYGNKRLDIVSVKDDTIYLLLHGKNIFRLFEYANLNSNIKIKVHRNILFPSIEINTEEGDLLQLQASKNKSCVYALKKLIKEKR